MKIEQHKNVVKQPIDARNIKVPTLKKATPPLDLAVKNNIPAPINVSCATSHKNQEGLRLLSVMWCSKDAFHQIGIMDRNTKVFRNLPVKNVIDALNQLDNIDKNSDSYFACAEYLSSDKRTAANVSGACAFWMDIDCGKDKDADKKGYLTKEIAKQELNSFCEKVVIPKPTHIVDSGNGLHVYWALKSSVTREEWQEAAKKLKQLTIKHNFKVDGSRTADIASVLRVPGTMNNKSTTPKPVKLIEENPELIMADTMLTSIDEAFKTLGVKTPTETKNASNHKTVTLKSVLPQLNKLKSALKMLDPDCDEATWKLRRIAPLANAAVDFPELSNELYETAKNWSSGELAETPSVAWSTPGNSNGLTGEEAFEIEWKRFLNSPFSGKRTDLGTIYYDAKEAGWNAPEEEFTTDNNVSSIIEAEKPLDPLQSLQAQFALINVNGKLYTFDKYRLEASEGKIAPKLELSNRTDGTLFLERSHAARFPNNDFQKLAKEFFKSPLTTCYDGVDFHPKGVDKNYLNLWVGPHRNAKKGGWEKIYSFLLDVICGGDEASYDYLIKYMAHALQRPEEKPGVMLILLGAQGIGKGTFGRIFQKIWTSTFLFVNNVDQVIGNFNASLERSFIVFMDEALFVGDKRAANALKSLVTESLIHINEKHQPARQTQSFHRFIAASNATHFKNTEHDDRRDFVLSVSDRYKGNTDYWIELEYEMNNDGIEAFMFELQEMDLTKFNVRCKPSTRALLEQKLMSLNSIEGWWYDCLEYGVIESCSGFGFMKVSNNDSWPDFIMSEDAIADIIVFTGNKIYKKPSAKDVAGIITKLCPSAKSAQRQENNKRHRGLSLPPLQVARAEFETYIGGSVSWPDVNA